jgi:hypothetical protein
MQHVALQTSWMYDSDKQLGAAEAPAEALPTE